jgi:hypothetical protein
MNSALRGLGQAIAFGAFFAAIGVLSVSPTYRHRDPDAAQIMVAFAHAGTRVADCRRRTPEEIAALAPNMRRPDECGRGRVPLHFVLDVDAATVIDATLPSAGIADDGSASAYARIPVRAGTHRVVARLRDSRRDDGFDWERSIDVDLAPRQNFTIEFKPDEGGFVFRASS